MPRFDAAALARHHRHNRLQSLLVMVGIGGWMALIGWLVAGGEGVVIAALAAVLMLTVQPMRSTTLLRAMYGAIPLSAAAAPGLWALMGDIAGRAGLRRMPTLLYIPRAELVALSTGSGEDTAVALSDGMLRSLSPRELASVIAHEISHLRSGDLKLLRLAEAAGRLTRLLSLLGLFLMLFYLPLAGSVGVEVPLMSWLLLVAAPLVSDLLTLKLSRTREFEADAGAVELTGDPEALMSALARIEQVQPGGTWERLRARTLSRWLKLVRTHPTTQERLARLRELAPPAVPPWLPPPLDVLLIPAAMGNGAERRGWLGHR